MQSWSKITHYAGFDWATDHHDVVIVNGSGNIVADFKIEHTAQGWQRWREQVAALGEHKKVGADCGEWGKTKAV
jgi:hypothetical protein